MAARGSRLARRGRPGDRLPGSVPVTSLVGVLAITVVLFLVVAMTGRLILGR